MNDKYVLAEQWRPPWALHIEGFYEAERYDEDGFREPQMVVATCTVCRAVFRRRCDSGRVRQHIATFARLHLHRDPLAGEERR